MSLPLLSVCGLAAYDGTEYHGFQLQRDVPTIQGSLEDALTSVTQSPVRVIGAGRTDAGVHANGQVIAVHVPWRHAIEDLQRAWNAALPATIAVRGLQGAPLGFHPRFSALARTYRYSVVQAAVTTRSMPRRSPLTDRFALYVTDRLDVAAMNRAAACLVGEHDFATFGRPPVGTNTVRTVMDAGWQVAGSQLAPLSEYPGQRIVFTIRANAFLLHMVRNLVGALLQVGCGVVMAVDVQNALQACDRRRSAPPVPPQGLVLEQIDYPAELGLQLGA